MNKTFSNIAYLCGLILGLMLFYYGITPDKGIDTDIVGALFSIIIGPIMVIVFSILLARNLQEHYKNKKVSEQGQKFIK
jgi:predicted Kef-type K+ transport protein